MSNPAKLQAVLFTAMIVMSAQAAEPRDPAAWGEDHVGKPLPEFVTGGECLFCHRYDIGNGWQQNRHNLAMQEADPAVPGMESLASNESMRAILDEVRFLVGNTNRKRFLKPNGKYGQVSIHSSHWLPPTETNPGKAVVGDAPHWDDALFAEACAGCHATGVDMEYKGFSTPAIDCFACHGVVPEGHTADTSLALFSKKNAADPRVQMSICAQCHLRGGKSTKSGLPYAYQFAPGDNLFRDFKADFSDESIAKLNPGDAHVYLNVRDVVVNGDETMTCMTCHDVHGQSSRKHRTLKRLEKGTYCAVCHPNPDDYKALTAYEVHSETCRY